MSEKDGLRLYPSTVVGLVIISFVASFIITGIARNSVRAEVLRCLRAPDAESAAMACPQWMQEARR